VGKPSSSGQVVAGIQNYMLSKADPRNRLIMCDWRDVRMEANPRPMMPTAPVV
jgi:hypothetical protein